MYILYIANKNYSSWSLRPWCLMQELGIEFEERLVPFGAESNWATFRKFSPSGKVPCLVNGEHTIWDSLGITEYLAEKHPAVWPKDVGARAWARCAAAEMHSGFMALRENCSMSCGIRVRLSDTPEALERDLQRVDELWTEGLNRFAGPFLAGSSFTAVDAFYAPVAFRIQTFGLTLSDAAAAYATRLLKLESMKRWYAAALAEPWREEGHEVEISRRGVILEDLRAA